MSTFLKKLFTPILVLSLFVSLFSSVSTKAATKELRINKKNSNEFNKTLQNFKEKDPQKAVSQKLEKNKNNENELNSNQSDNLQIKFSLKDKKVKLKNKNKGDVSVGIPNIDSFDSVDVVDNKVIYSGQNSKADVIVESVDGGFRQVINIKDSSAPDFYDFPVELGIGEKLVVNPDGNAAIIRPKSPKELENDQKISKDIPKDIKIPDYSTKLIIGKPWAKDASGKDLKTNYSVENGNILRQRIDLKDAVFPVVADPIWCGDFFSRVFWENRASEGGLSLRNFPTSCGRNYDTGYGFDEILSKAPANDAWPASNRNYTSTQGRSMYNQYRCHVWFASAYKESYNLEPKRPLVNWTTMITRNFPYACNP